MAGSLGEFGLSQSDRTPEFVETKERPDTQKYIPYLDEVWRSTVGITRDGLGQSWAGEAGSRRSL